MYWELMFSPVAHRSCLFDMCVEGDEVATLCRSLEEYVLACQQQEVSVDGWRQQTSCGKHRKNQKVGILPTGLLKSEV